MKRCFSTLVCPEWDLKQIVDGAVRYEMQGVDFRGVKAEIDITRAKEFGEGLGDTLKLMRRQGLEMPCFNTSVTLISPVPDRWQMMLEECHRYARLAEKTGTRMLRIFGGAVPKGMPRNDARAMGIRHLRQVVKICRAAGCVPLLETHDEWATSDQVLELLHEFDPAEVGVLWDIQAPCRRGENPRDTAARLRKFIRHVHLKDSLRIAGKDEPRLLGQGDLPLAECMAALKGIEYQGWICLETERRWFGDKAPEPEESLRQFGEWMTEVTSC